MYRIMIQKTEGNPHLRVQLNIVGEGQNQIQRMDSMELITLSMN